MVQVREKKNPDEAMRVSIWAARKAFLGFYVGTGLSEQERKAGVGENLRKKKKTWVGTWA